MGKLQVLDCTLRDGGYCNNWEFGSANIKKILTGLQEAKVDIIECGFLSNQVQYDEERTRFPDIHSISALIPEQKTGQKYVCMINYGDYNLEDIPNSDSGRIDGIRVAFHKKDFVEATKFCGELSQKGYLVFIQAMVSLNYSDSEFLQLIELANQVDPYAFYIVDSFGVMTRRDMERFFWLIDHNLRADILLGFHSHNNMQLSYSNAQTFAEMRTSRGLIVDSSILGMGRGAGNLNTELYVEYLNELTGSQYDLKPLLAIIDETLSVFYRKNPWGYSLPNYLSAAHNAHPNYASYLASKHTLTVAAMDQIFNMMPEEKKKSYDQEYIEKLYISYQSSAENLDEHFTEIQEKLGECVLLIAPGKSSKDEKDKILKYIQQTGIKTISINHDYPYYDTDYIFVSNSRRFKELPLEKHEKCIVTSNIPASDVYSKVSYGSLLNNVEPVRDNGGMMSIQYLISLGVKKILLAGMDGYSYSAEMNYAKDEMSYRETFTVYDNMNTGMEKVLNKYTKKVKIKFLTTPRMITIK